MARIKSDFYFVIDYMLGTIIYYLLLILYFNDHPIVLSRSFKLPCKSQNNNKGVQSARNFTRSSETIRQLFKDSTRSYSSNSVQNNSSFYHWLAGVIDGDGNFDIRKTSTGGLVLKAIKIKLHNRDLRILTRIQNSLHIGRIRSVKNKPYSFYILSQKTEMTYLVNSINGLIRLKVPSFKKACSLLDIIYIEPDYNIPPLDPYFAGLVDTDGSIVFNFNCNRIECNLEFKYNEYSSRLCLNSVIPHAKPNILLRSVKNQTPGKRFKTISFRFQSVQCMVPIYDYFIVNRLYSDFKFFRATQIKPFISIRQYAKYPFGSPEFKVYSNFLLKFIQHMNPSWTKVPFLNKLDLN